MQTLECQKPGTHMIFLIPYVQDIVLGLAIEYISHNLIDAKKSFPRFHDDD